MEEPTGESNGTLGGALPLSVPNEPPSDQMASSNAGATIDRELFHVS